ncbi:MAG: triose-phosphate isomerase [Deltaproteobacteria bacterium]|nr:triose-phosphate isomerase [Deltaproteobacteria bacterium]MBW2634528.1 triose-phosphate isomerase [Deltaproteobacteria bacterium]
MSNRRPLIAGNWKMYKTCEESVEAAQKLTSLVDGVTDTDIMIAPTFTSLFSVYGVVKGSRVDLGAQNLYWEEEGAFTGEISAGMLKSAGCSSVIIGHSERRQYFGETDETVNKKIKAALSCGLKTVFCIGESEAQRDLNLTFSVLDKQVQTGLKDFVSDDLRDLVVAYEPIWAIGTGKTATSEQAQEVHTFLRASIAKQFDEPLAQSIRILYGGSVKPGNIAELMSMHDIDGALVGGASLDAETFSQIVKF